MNCSKFEIYTFITFIKLQTISQTFSLNNNSKIKNHRSNIDFETKSQAGMGIEIIGVDPRKMGKCNFLSPKTIQ